MCKLFNIPLSLKAAGVNRADFEKRVAIIADRAFEDQCTPANPKLPLVSELKTFYAKLLKALKQNNGFHFGRGALYVKGTEEVLAKTLM